MLLSIAKGHMILDRTVAIPLGLNVCCGLFATVVHLGPHVWLPSKSKDMAQNAGEKHLSGLGLLCLWS